MSTSAETIPAPPSPLSTDTTTSSASSDDVSTTSPSNDLDSVTTPDTPTAMHARSVTSPAAPVIAFINQTSKTTDAEIAKVAAALSRQVKEDFAPFHGKTVSAVVAVPKGQKPPPGSWWMVFTDTSDEAGALGYHDLTNEDLPLGKVFVETTKADGGVWSVTASHEILEMLADPYLVKTACIQTERSSKLYAWEVCDACEADTLAYLIDGVLVSDFVTEAWFDPTNKHGPFDFKGHIRSALQLLHGGYISVMDLSRAGDWKQITAARDGHSIASGPSTRKADYHERARVGSRREKRRADRDHWQRSTAHSK